MFLPSLIFAEDIIYDKFDIKVPYTEGTKVKDVTYKIYVSTIEDGENLKERTSDFKIENLIAVRDSFLKKYIAGPSEGSYMTTELANYPPTYREMDVNGVYCMEVRGLWKVEGDFMGGPFMSRSYYDKKKNDIVTVETFVYAPQHKKRNKIRLMEAITTSVDFE